MTGNDEASTTVATTDRLTFSPGKISENGEREFAWKAWWECSVCSEMIDIKDLTPETIQSLRHRYLKTLCCEECAVTVRTHKVH